MYFNKINILDYIVLNEKVHVLVFHQLQNYICLQGKQI